MAIVRRKKKVKKEEEEIKLKRIPRLIRDCQSCHIPQNNIVHTWDGRMLCTECAAEEYRKDKLIDKIVKVEDPEEQNYCCGCGEKVNKDEIYCDYCKEGLDTGVFVGHNNQDDDRGQGENQIWS